MFTFLIVLHVLICFIIIISVMLQPGKGDMGAGFGGGGGQALFGGRGPVTFLSKVTWVGIALLMFTSITLSIYTKQNALSSSVIDMSEPEETTTPAKAASTKSPEASSSDSKPANSEAHTSGE